MRTAAKAAAVVAALLVLAGSGVYFYLRRSLPVVDGTLSVAGISGPVDIVRDADDIPHVFAKSRADGLFGLGYVHAQDRLWQMELQRRIGFGRLSEVLGAAALSQDRFLRTVGFGRAARAAWDSLDVETRQLATAYIAGVNAFVSTHHGSQLPPEFTLLRFEPEPWTGPDVMVWIKMMAWDLSGNYSLELLRHDLLRTVGDDRMHQLMPPYPHDGLSIVPRRSVDDSFPGALLTTPAPISGMPSWAQAFNAALSGGDPGVADVLLSGGRTEALGSNNWVVDGTLSASGKPLLANDPHLGTRIPSTWYLAHISTTDNDVIGATLPGVPAVALGRNRFIAWGATNVAADVEDLYREQLDASGRFAMFQGAQEPLTIAQETILVKGAAAVHLDVRISRHGPLVSDAINANFAALPPAKRPPPVEALAFRWTALDPTDSTLTSFLKLNGARNWQDFTAALREFVVPSQNFVYADIDGHIGYYAPGRIPIRTKGDGSVPVNGWTGEAEWNGWVPFDELPHAFDPPEHFIVTANNRPASFDYPHVLGVDWVEPYRAQRIVDLLRERRLFGPDDFARIQGDTLSLHARTLAPLLVAHAHPTEGMDAQALDTLRHWNFDARGDAAAPAIFEAWFLQLAPALAGDALGPIVLEDYASRFSYITRFVVSALGSGSRWCDDLKAQPRGSCDERITSALHKAVEDLKARLGSDVESWRWDAVHRAVFPHQGLDAVGLFRPFLSRSVPNGGDWSTVNVGPVSADRPYQQRSVSGYREIIDLSPANDSRFLDAVGQSGHFLSPHYDDSLPLWSAVRHRPMRMTRPDVERGALGRLRFEKMGAGN